MDKLSPAPNIPRTEAGNKFKHRREPECINLPVLGWSVSNMPGHTFCRGSLSSPSEKLTALCCWSKPHWDTRKDRRPWHCDSAPSYTRIWEHTFHLDQSWFYSHISAQLPSNREDSGCGRGHLIQYKGCQCQLTVLKFTLGQCCLRFWSTSL